MSQVNDNPEQLLPSALQGQKPNAIGYLQMNMLQLLKNFYQDPLTSMVREIIFNAIDATRLLPVAQRQPIDIHLPSKTEPFFAVTDHAGGMSPSEVKNVYLNPGISTKNNDQQIGSYGLSAQAPLSYTQTFRVTTVKDQQETTCLISLQQVQLYANKTTAANGTMVKIPLSQEQDIDKFYAAVKTYAIMPVPGIQFKGLDYFWQDFHPYGEIIKCGTIQVDQQSLPVYWHCTDYSSQISAQKFFYCFGDIYRKLARDEITAFKEQSNMLIQVTLDGFEYPLSSVTHDFYGYEFIIKIKPGMVNFSFGRDKIIPDNKRQQLLQAFYEQIAASFFKNLKTVGLCNLLNTEMFPWAVRACAFFYLANPDQFPVVHNDPLLMKKLFTDQQQVNLWSLEPRPLALLDLQHQQQSEIEFQLTNVHNRKELLNVVKTRFDDPQQRPSLFNLWYYHYQDFFPDNPQWIASFFHGGIIHVFTDLNNFNLVKKVFHKRKEIILSTLNPDQTIDKPDILLLFQEPQAQVQPVVQRILGGMSVTIKYYSRPQAEQLLKKFKPITTTTTLPQALQPFNSVIIDNALDFYQLCCDSTHYVDVANPGFDLNLGLIVDNQPATTVISTFGENILKMIFFFQSKNKLKVNLYRAGKLKSYNMQQLQQQNDLVLCLHAFSRKSVQHYVSQLTLPDRKITLSNHTQDLLLLLLYWSQILGQSTAEDYDSLRLTLEKLLQLHLVRYDPQRFNLLWQTVQFSLSPAAGYDSQPLKIPHLYRPIIQILDDFAPLYQVFNNALQNGHLDVQSIKTAQVQADIKFVQQYWQNVRIQKQQQTKAPLLDFNSYIVHSYLTK